MKKEDVWNQEINPDGISETLENLNHDVWDRGYYKETDDGKKWCEDCMTRCYGEKWKSCSSYAFKKFKEGRLRDDDPFGYISQLSSYVYAGKDDPLVTNKTHGAFLAVDKQNGHVCLDVYDFSKELETKEKEILEVKDMVKGDIPEERIDPIPQSKTSPNTKLSMQCSYCEYKKTCWPEMRTFLYSYGPEFLIKVKNKPKVKEVIHEQIS